MQDKQVIVFLEEWFQLPAPSQYQAITENIEVCLCFVETIQYIKV